MREAALTAGLGTMVNRQDFGLLENGKLKSGDAVIGETGRYEMEGEKISRKKTAARGLPPLTFVGGRKENAATGAGLRRRGSGDA